MVLNVGYRDYQNSTQKFGFFQRPPYHFYPFAGSEGVDCFMAFLSTSHDYYQSVDLFECVFYRLKMPLMKWLKTPDEDAGFHPLRSRKGLNLKIANFARMEKIIAGIDLAGSKRRPTGIAFLSRRRIVETVLVFTDEDIISKVHSYDPILIGIDAPLSLPKGRRTIESKDGPKFRECDLALYRLGIRFFPIVLGPMRMLTSRGIKLKDELTGMGFKVVEVYPGATQDILGIPRKSKGLDVLRLGLKNWVVGSLDGLSGDELDAVTAALTVELYIEGRGEFIGDPEEGLILIPKVMRNGRNIG